MSIYEETADLLEKAADVIFTRGHCKNSLEDSEGKVCAIGALNAAYNNNNNNEDYLTLAIFKLRDKTGLYVSSWNDLPETTAEEIMDTMKEVAKDLRNSEGGSSNEH